MPRRKRAEKQRTGAIDSQQRLDLILSPGRLGRPGVDGRVGRLWEDDAHRESAYFEHRDTLLPRFYVDGAPPPGAAIDYDDDPEFIRAVIDYYLQRARTELERQPHPWADPERVRAFNDHYAELVAELEALEGDPGDARRAYDLSWWACRRRVMEARER